MKTSKLKSKWVILILLLVVLVAGVVFYFTWNISPNDAASEGTETGTFAENDPMPISTEVSAVDEQMSPISPVSPVSPLPVQTGVATLSPEELQAILDSSIAAQAQGDYEQVIELTNSLLDNDPTDFLALNIRGSAYLSLGDYEQALVDYSTAITREPFFPHAYYNRGRVHRLMGDYEQALADLQKSIDLAPLEFGYKANGNIGLIYYSQGDYEKSLEALNRSIELNVEDKADVYYYRGETYTAMDNYEAAATDYEAAIERFPNFSLAYRGLAFARYKLGQLDAATEALNQANAISPGHPASLFYQGLVLLASDQFNPAATSIEQGIEALNALSTEEKEALAERMVEELGSLAEESPEEKALIQSFVDRLNAVD